MKKRAIFTAVAALAISVTAASFAACGSGANGSSLKTTSKLNIANYAEDVTAELKDGATAAGGSIVSSKKLISSATELLSANPSEISGSGDLRVVEKTVAGEKTYSVYNLALEKFVLTASTVQPVLGSSGGLPVITVDTTSAYADYYTYEVRLSDGSVLLSNGNYETEPAVESHYAYAGSGKKPSLIYKISARRVSAVASADNLASAFVQRIVDGETSEVSYKIVPADSIRLYSADYDKGAVVDALVKIGDVISANKPYEGPLKKVSVEMVNATFANVYYDGKKVGELNNSDMVPLGFVGSKMYYNHMIGVDPYAAAGYNYVSQSDGTVYKYKVELRSLDLTNGKTDSYNYDFVAKSISPVYNHVSKDYDAAIITGEARTDGIAYSGQSAVSYLVDSDLKMACDLTNYGEVDCCYSIGDGKYLLGTCIFDGSLKYVGRISGAYYSDEKLEKISTYDGAVYTDMNHKVVIEPRYFGTSGFFGGYMYGIEGSLDGESRRVIISKNGAVKNLEEYIADKDRDTVTVNTSLGVYTVKKAEAAASGVAYTYTVYNFAGDVLFTYGSLYSAAPSFSGKYATYTVTERNASTLEVTSTVHIVKLA